MSSRYLNGVLLVFMLGAGCFAADDAGELQKKGVAALKESQTNPEALVPAARFFAKASAAFEAAGQPDLAVDANSFLYYCKKKMTLRDIEAFLKGEDAAVSERLNKIENKPAGAFEAQAWLERAEAFAKGNPTEQFLVTVRYFEVAERFKDSEVGRAAMSRSLEAMQKVIASEKAKPAPGTEAVKPAAPAVAGVAQKPRTVNLLPLIDLTKDALAGKWTFNEQHQLVGQKASEARVQIPYKPPEEYDFKMVFMRVEGDDVVGQICSKGDHYFCWFIDAWNSAYSGLELINGKGARENETSTKGALLKNKQWHTSVVQVRKDGVTALLDGRPIAKLKTNFENLSSHPNWKLRPDGGLGLNLSGKNVVIYATVELLEVTGRGEKLR